MQALVAAQASPSDLTTKLEGQEEVLKAIAKETAAAARAAADVPSPSAPVRRVPGQGGGCKMMGGAGSEPGMPDKFSKMQQKYMVFAWFFLLIGLCGTAAAISAFTHPNLDMTATLRSIGVFHGINKKYHVWKDKTLKGKSLHLGGGSSKQRRLSDQDKRAIEGAVAKKARITLGITRQDVAIDGA